MSAKTIADRVALVLFCLLMFVVVWLQGLLLTDWLWKIFGEDACWASVLGRDYTRSQALPAFYFLVVVQVIAMIAAGLTRRYLLLAGATNPAVFRMAPDRVYVSALTAQLSRMSDARQSEED